MTSATSTPEPIHPGGHLAEIMEELGISQYRLAKCIGVPPIRVHAIVKGQRSITADSALRIGRALGTTPEFWLNLQRMYDLEVARAESDVSGTEPLVGGDSMTASTINPWTACPVLSSIGCSSGADQLS